jgi:hypothetical protein
MKTPNSLEERMKSWTPRPPSPHIEAHLFRPPAQPAAARKPSFAWYQTLSITAAACLVMALTIFNVTRLAGPGASTLGASFMPWSNSYVAMISAPHNTWTAPILGWTNIGGSGSSIRSFDLINTNRPLR